MTECKIEQNKTMCNCTYPCEKKGMCCMCIKYHRERDELPACYFPHQIESTYDRSIENFIRMYQSK